MSMSLRKLLIISPHFPPVHAPDSERVRTALKHLRDFQWDPTVLCVAPDYVDAFKDPDSVASIPAEIPIHYCQAWPLNVTKRMGMSNLGWRAKGSMKRLGRKIIASTKPDLILFSTTQHPIVALAPLWKREFGIPYVIDIQDPWLTDNYERPGAPPPPGGWKYRFARAIASHYEAPTYQAAQGFVSVSPLYFESLAKRYPWFGNKPQRVIPFGVDVDESNQPTIPPAFQKRDDRITLVSIGAVGNIMNQAIHTLCVHLAGLRDTRPALFNRIRIKFFGTSYAPAHLAKPSVLPIAQQYNLEATITESTDRIPRAGVTSTNQEADALLILTSDDPAYTPSKLAGCFAANRPVLLITDNSSQSAKISQQLGLAQTLPISSTDHTILGSFLDDFTGDGQRWKQRRRQDLFDQTFTSRARTDQLADFLHQVV